MHSLRRVISLVAINALVLATLLGVAEIVARLAFPEFQGHLHTPTKTLGVNYFFGDFHGIQVRVPSEGATLEDRKPLFVVLGDSVSNGYGMSYEDIYWVQLSRRSPSAGELEFVALAGYGNNLKDSAKSIGELARQPGVKIRHLLYQFNFNDVTPLASADLHAPSGEKSQSLIRTFAA